MYNIAHVILFIFLTPLFSACFSLLSFCQSSFYSPMIYEDYIEKTTYDISLYGVSIGKIDAVIGGDTLFRGEAVYMAHFRVYSQVALPFLGMEDNHYYTFFRLSEGKIIPIFHWKDDVDEKEFMEYSCDFDLLGKSVNYHYKKTNKQTKFLLDLWGSCGVMPAIYLRMLSMLEASYQLPIYVNFKRSNLDVNVFHKPQRLPFIWQNHRSAIFLVARTDFKGIWGFSGLLHLWLSFDKKRLPLAARVFTQLGTIEIRILSYKQYAK